MNKLITRYIFLFVILLAGIEYLSAQQNTELKKDKNGIKVFSREIEDSDFDSFTANMVVDGTVNTFVAVIKDMEIFPDWGYNIVSVEILETSGDTLQIYYSEASAPFPFKNRDGIYLNHFRWIADSNTLFVDIELLHNYLELKDNLVRVSGNGYWRVQQLDNNKLDITFHMYINSGGNIPSWLSNMFIDEAPYNTLLKLRDVMKKEEYQNQNFDFIY